LLLHTLGSLKVKKLSGIIALAFSFSIILPQQANSLEPVNVGSLISRLTGSASLSNPSVIFIDESTGQVVYEKDSNSLRKPASLMKLYTAAAALTYLDPQQKFTTSTWVGTADKSLVIQGSYDPWISFLSAQAKKMNRTSLPRLESKTLSAFREVNGKARAAKIYYVDLYPREVSHIKSYFSRNRIRATMIKVNREDALKKSHYMISSSESPALETMLSFALMWSDNVLSERIARLSARAAGYSFTDKGVSQAFSEVLNTLNVAQGDQIIKDASGLSKENRVRATQIAQLLLQLKKNSKFAPVIGGLPVGGISGTLRHRFIENAPQAIGLVRAKSGSLNGTVNLAGYVEAGDREYVFVIIADQLKVGFKSEKTARNTIDKILGKVAAPLLPVLPNSNSEVTTATSSAS
jgi:D-alanyl-D-alanine carboxypeptidase/D-alanyl-D-alanine-endopeptidase (penicillin-binding protein 4)